MAGLLGRKFEVPFQENLKFSARHLREPQKMAGLLGSRNLKFSARHLREPQKNGRAIGEQGPQMFGEAMERTWKSGAGKVERCAAV